MLNPEDISDLTTAMNMTLVLIAKAFKLNYSTPTKNNQRISSNPRNMQIAQPGMNMGQDRQMQMIGGNGGNLFEQYAGKMTENQNRYNATQNIGNQVVQNAVHNLAVQNVRNQNGLIVVSRIANLNANQNRNGLLCNTVSQAKEKGCCLSSYSVADYSKGRSRDSTQSLEFELMPLRRGFLRDQEHNGGTVEQHPATVEETHAYFESLYNNLTIEIEKEQCLTKKINALHLSSAKTITTLNEEIANLNNQLSKEKSTVSYLQQEKKKLKSDFKICEDELLDKQIQLENKIKELDNILVKMAQSIQTMHMLSPKPDSFYHNEQKMALGYQNPFYLKQAQQKQHSLYNGKVLLEKHDPPAVYDSDETLQRAQESRLKMKQLNK
ncbi:hypothetical protein Tco_0862747 [Tanacetum coccineum]